MVRPTPRAIWAHSGRSKVKATYISRMTKPTMAAAPTRHPTPHFASGLISSLRLMLTRPLFRTSDLHLSSIPT